MEAKDEAIRRCSLQKEKTIWTVNWDMLPYKIHFFLFCGALSGVLPYKTVFSKARLGLRAKDIAVLYTSQQFIIVISKTVIGLFVDYLNKLKFSIIVISIMQAVFYLGLLAIPAIETESNVELSQRSKINFVESKADFGSLPVDFSSCSSTSCWSTCVCENQEYCTLRVLCSENATNIRIIFVRFENSSCSLVCFQNSISSVQDNFRGDALTIFTINLADKVSENLLQEQVARNVSVFRVKTCDRFSSKKGDSYHYFSLNNTNTSVTCIDLVYQARDSQWTRTCTFEVLSTQESHHNTYWQIVEAQDEDSREHTVTGDQLYYTYQFWLFALLLMLGGLSSNALFTMSDTACYESLQKTNSDYGRQRAWGAVSWGILAPFAGFLNDVATKKSGFTNYSPGFYLNALLTVLLVANICRLDLAKPNVSKDFWRDLRRVFKSKEFIVFETGVFMTGIFTGVLWFYLMIFLESLGSTKFLLGLVHTCQCFLGEVPLMFVSGWILRKIGHMKVLSLTFLAFTVRFACYHFLVNPWFVLPVEMLHGLTYGVFYAGMTSYAKQSSLSGAEATTQSVLCCTYEGLGAGVGCVVAGIIYDRLGGRTMFLVASLSSFAVLLLHMIASSTLTSHSKTMKVEPVHSVETC